MSWHVVITDNTSQSSCTVQRSFDRIEGGRLSLCSLCFFAAIDKLVRLMSDLVSVALAAGFSDQSHFTRVFKQVTGMTPGVFRAATTSRPS